MKRRTVVLAGVAVAGVIALRQLSTPHQMPHLALWQRELAERRGDAEAARITSRAQARYDELCAGQPRTANRVLRIHLQRFILPGLALYQTLLRKSDDRQAVLAEMEYLITSSMAGYPSLAPLLVRVRDPFPILRRVLPWLMRLGFPAAGWNLEHVEDSQDCLAFDIRSCFILDTLTSYGAPELTPAYCAQDDVRFAKLPPSITFERTVTLGRGDDRCDFRWCRAAPEGTMSDARQR